MKPLAGKELAAFRDLDAAAQLKQIRGQISERAFTVQRDTIDQTARTAWLSIASDRPYERWWGVEILDMKTKSIRTERLDSGANLLVGHDTADVVGVVEKYEISADGKLRILARFGRSARAEEIFQDVIGGIRQNTSVGYIIHDLVLEKSEEGVNTYRVTDWEPLEGSLVSVPADPGVGLGRALEPPANERKEMTPEEKAKYDADLRAKVRAEFETEQREKEKLAANTPEAILKREQDRVSGIMAAGVEFKDHDLAMEMIKDPAATVDIFKARKLEKMRDTVRPLKTAQPGGNGQIPNHYETGVRVRYQYGKLRCFKDLPLEDGGTLKAEEAAFRSGMWLAAAIHKKNWAQTWCREHGMPVVYRDVDSNEQTFMADHAEQRAANENVLSAGAALVPIEMEASIIQLRDTYGLFRQLARMRPMNSDTLKIPRRRGGTTAYFFQDDDGAGITESAKLWDNVSFSTKKLGTLNKVSRDLVEDAVISVIDDLGQENAYAFAVKEDQCGLIGDGTSTYGGIQGVNNKFEATAYISRTALTTGHDLLSEVDNTDITTVMGNLAQFADTPEAVFVCSHLAKHMIFNRLKAVAGGNQVATLGEAPNNSYLGYRIFTSEAMPKVTSTLVNKVMFLFGRFDLAASLGARRGIEMQTLVERYAELGQIGVITTERFDIVVHDLGTTSAADINGGRGPIAAGYGA